PRAAGPARCGSSAEGRSSPRVYPAPKTKTAPSRVAARGGRSVDPGTLREELGDGLRLIQLARLLQVGHHQRLGVDSARVSDRRMALRRLHWIPDWCRPRLVGLAVLGAALDAAACAQRRVAVGPVVAAVGALAVARRAHAALRAAAELADRDHQRLVQHAAP